MQSRQPDLPDFLEVRRSPPPGSVQRDGRAVGADRGAHQVFCGGLAVHLAGQLTDLVV